MGQILACEPYVGDPWSVSVCLFFFKNVHAVMIGTAPRQSAYFSALLSSLMNVSNFFRLSCVPKGLFLEQNFYRPHVFSCCLQ